MKYCLYILTLFLSLSSLYAQEQDRQLLRGQVLYRNSSVANENVINTTAEKATITNSRGEFTIPVKVGDELIFTAVNYQIEILTVTEAMLANNRLVIEVNEKVTELDEVVISPERQEKFLELQNEEFKRYEYETDATAEVENIAMDPTTRGMKDGLNFVNIFKALASIGKDEPEAAQPKLKMSEVLRKVYDDRFFVADLNVPQDKIDDFLYYVDDHSPEYKLLLKDNEFQLIDFLVNQSKAYRAQLDAKQ
ncbi:hypothetical protein PP178_14620 [Zeaxanthinibacter sp. PT1]|uniref:hypothetical protein n=1 Tax=Zeaxanthinibacter TaxID=561554 RepID=UPI00234B8464|nr:hypothetical protein [Zeaxanthinibacter sp. PT1]MDC6352792.1 hypothetical protein [Zeaxanthinibacter sp. PT1]